MCVTGMIFNSDVTVLGRSSRSFIFFSGSKYGLQTRAMRGQDFLAHAANRQHPSAQGDLAGHADVSEDGPARQRGDHGGRHRDARRRTILGNGAFGHVDVNIHPLKDLQINSQGRGAGFDVGQRRPAPNSCITSPI